MTISGKIDAIMPEVQISEKFKKREFVIQTNDQYPQSIILQFVQDKCQLVDKLSIGQEVKCHINIQGRKHTNKEGKENWFNTLVCWKIDLESVQEPIPDDDFPY